MTKSDLFAWALIVAFLFMCETLIIAGPNHHAGVSSYAKGIQVQPTGKQWRV